MRNIFKRDEREEKDERFVCERVKERQRERVETERGTERQTERVSERDKVCTV